MKNMLAICITLLVLVALALPIEACGRSCCSAPCCAPCCEITYVDKVVTCYRPEWRTKDVTCTINKMVPRTVTSIHKCTIMVPEWKSEKRTVTCCKLVPREVEREVTCCRMVSATCKDPCTGCTYTCCKPETYTTKVKCTVWDTVHEKKDVVVQVCHHHAEERTFECKHIVWDCKPETVTRKVSYCQMVPYTTTVKVAVCR